MLFQNKPLPEEDAFFKEVLKQAKKAKLNPSLLSFKPMSDKSFSVNYGSYPIGKIKLNGKGTYMQLLIGLQDVKVLSDLSLKEYMTHIPAWIKHIKYCLK